MWGESVISELALWAWSYAKEHWGGICAVLLVLVIFDDVMLRGKLAACQSSKMVLAQAQSLTNTASANSSLKGKITIQPCGGASTPNDRKCPPCGAITVDFEALNNAYAEGVASQSQKAEIKPTSAENTGKLSLWASYHVSSRFLTIGPSYRFGIYSLGAGISKPVNDQIFKSFDGLEPALFVNLGPF
jgi:hypothetical protein